MTSEMYADLDEQNLYVRVHLLPAQYYSIYLQKRREGWVET